MSEPSRSEPRLVVVDRGRELQLRRGGAAREAREHRVVLDFVGEPRNLPAWAPGAPADLDIRVFRELATVDFVAGARRAYSRVLPNGHGTEYLFTRFFAESTPADEIARDDAVIAQELETVRQLTT